MESRSNLKKMWEQFSSELGSRIDRWRQAVSIEMPGKTKVIFATSSFDLIIFSIFGHIIRCVM